MWVCRNVMFTTHQIDGEHTTHKNGDEWVVVYIAIPTLLEKNAQTYNYSTV